MKEKLAVVMMEIEEKEWLWGVSFLAKERMGLPFKISSIRECLIHKYFRRVLILKGRYLSLIGSK